MLNRQLLIILFTVLVLAGTYTSNLQSLEEFSYNGFVRLLPNLETEPRSAIIAIDNASLEKYGPWPWPRQRLAKIVKQLEKYQAGAIGMIVPLDQPQSLSLPETYQSVLEGSSPEVREKVLALVDQLDPDANFSDTLLKSDKVILAIPYWSEQAGLIGAISNDLSMILQPLQTIAPTKFKELLLDALIATPTVKRHIGQAPVSTFALSSSGVGLARLGRDDETVLSESLAVRLDQKYVPSFALLLAAQTVGLSQDAITVLQSRGIGFGSAMYHTDAGLKYYPRPIFDKEGEPARIPVISVADLLQGNVNKQLIKNKATVLGFTSTTYVAPFAGPGQMQLSPAGWSAHVTDSLLAGTSINTPYWALGLQRGLVVFFALYLLFLPRMLRGRIGQLLSLLFAFLLLNASLLAILVKSLWLPLTIPAVFVLVGHVLITIYHRVAQKLAAQRTEVAVAYLDLAENLHSQGKLDLAFQNLKKCPPDTSILESLYTIALDYERRRQFSKAITVYDYIARIDSNYRDIQERRERHQAVPDATSFNGATTSNLTATLVVNDSKVERPVLGRYRIERELGRGAMGMVYLGKDPKIGRTVAIKTLPLTDEFDSEDLEEVRTRFFVEAEAAGRLNHPNIVTIYDAGEEHDLAYIAMDYIEGDSLDSFTTPDNLLPVEDVFKIGINVAEALDYAHKKNVVHRDIKPGNILYNRETDTLKVTDFGVACLIDTNKTRTGTVLGSPSYMSPEQLAGKKVDGRSDIFSLGVTLYQLFTGELPFNADSMAALAYKITNDKPKGVRRIRADLPTCLSRIINKAMEKGPKQRFSNGNAFADALRRCEPK
ncbi:CHASE2 domain-containing serine/threonine-protein kinase [Kaarinaea lacus]